MSVIIWHLELIPLARMQLKCAENILKNTVPKNWHMRNHCIPDTEYSPICQ